MVATGSWKRVKVLKHFYSVSRISRKMPPKKKSTDEKPAPLMGRIGTSLKCGIVGLPNVGKSTFFNVLTKSAAAAENFPFCTIDPNENKRRVPVPDERYDWLCEHHKPASKVPAFLLVTDIAGLVEGASEGKGLGNAFLSHISACDALFHVVRVFEDGDVIHVEDDINPVRDLQIISEELRKKDEQYLNARMTNIHQELVNFITRLSSRSVVATEIQYTQPSGKDNMQRNAVRGGGDKKAKLECDILTKVHKLVTEEKKDVRFGEWNTHEIEVLNKHLFLSSKPVIYLVNLSEKDYIRKKNKWLLKIKEWIDERDPGALLIPFSGAFELNLLDMADDEREKYLKEHKMTSALHKIIVTGFKTLQLEYFFTGGKDEVKAWTIQTGSKAPQAAGRIHTDFEKGFIMAEVMKFDDLKELGSENAVKSAGKYRQEGKNYVVHDGDVIFFKFNAGAGLTDKKAKK